MGRLVVSVGVLAATLLLAAAASAQEEPVGPCSPYRAVDGDIPSEMPGCLRRWRPAPGSLADELEFRRRRADPEPEQGAVPDDGGPPPVVRGHRPNRRHRPDG